MVGRTQMKKISHITSYLFENQLIISLSKDWMKTFGGLPQFDVFIDSKNKLVIISKDRIRSGDVVSE